MTLQPGTRVGGVVVDALLGVGGTAAVYRCHVERTGRALALKVLDRDHSRHEPSARPRFRREVEALRTLDHPAIVSLHDADTEGPEPWMLVDLVDGRTLDEYRRDRAGHIPLHESALLLWPVADALDHAHAAGLVHRDIKPHNILVPRHPYGGPSAVLTDFGIAVRDGDGSLTETGYSIGTARYMAPEQLGGDEVGPPADQYALALVLGELVTGSVSVHGAAGLFGRATAGPELEVLRGPLTRALDMDPARRFPSCTAFLEAVTAAAAHRSTAPLPRPVATRREPSHPPRPPRPPQPVPARRSVEQTRDRGDTTVVIWVTTLLLLCVLAAVAIAVGLT